MWRRSSTASGELPCISGSGRRVQRLSRPSAARITSHLAFAALSAARFNPDLKIVYDRLRAAEKRPKVVLVAVMRKLIILANRHGRAKPRLGAPSPLTPNTDAHPIRRR